MKWFRIYLASLFLLTYAIAAQAQTLGDVTNNSGSWSLDHAPDIDDDLDKLYVTPFLTIGNQTIYSDERAITAGTCITGTDAGANSTYTVAITAACIDASLLATDSVSADELNATGVEAELEAVIDLADLQGSLTLAGDVDGAHGSNDIDEAAVETELESVLDVADLQGFSVVLTEAEAAAAYQPLDADLTSWAGVTRASGFDTFVATPSMVNLGSLLTNDASGWTTFGQTPTSANLAALVTDETGTGGGVVFATDPDITISATTESNIEAALDTLANVTSIGGDVTAGGDFISTDDIISGDDILLSDAGVINFGAGDCTLTDGTNLLTMDGCDLTTEVITPDGDNTRDLGSGAATWATAHINAIELANGTVNTLTATGGALSIEGVALLPDATDSVDATNLAPDSVGASELNIGDAEAEIEGAIDTLANLTSIQGFAFDLDDNNLDELWGWDDSAGTFDNFSIADITTEATPAVGDFLLIYAAEGDLRKVDWDDLPGAGSGVDNFLDLTDTPDSYVGFAGDCVKVNGPEDALEFDTCAAGSGDDLGDHTATENLKMATFDIDFGTGDVVIDYSANDLAFTGVTGDYSFDDTVGVTGNVVASVDVVATAGDVTSGDDIISGDDILLSDAGVINFNAGDCTLTEGTNTLTLAGTCTLVSEIIVPDGDNTRDLGSGAATWATAHINSIELANGTANTLTATGGALSIEGVALLPDATDSVDATNLAPDSVGASELNIGDAESEIETALDTLANVTSIGGDVTAGGDFISTDDIISGDDVLLSNAGVINFGAGDCTLTEGTDTLTIAGTCVLVTEAAGLQIGASVPFSDSAGTLTLQNVDALDGTSESTIEAAIDTLDNVAAIGATTESTIEAAIDTLANLTSVQGFAFDLDDNNLDELWGWDDSASTFDNFSLADITTEGTPAAGDFLLAYRAEGDLVKIDWDDLPSGSGIANVVEDLTPQLGGDLDANTFDILFDDGDGIHGATDIPLMTFAEAAASVTIHRSSNDFPHGWGNNLKLVAPDYPALWFNGIDQDLGLLYAYDSTVELFYMERVVAGVADGTDSVFWDMANTAFYPSAGDGWTLGTSGNPWASLFADALESVNSIDADTEATIEAALDTLANVTSIGGDVTAGGDFISTDDLISGDDVFLSDAGVVNFGAGDCTLTDGTNMLTMDGCDLTTEVIVPDGDNTRDLGSTGATWATAHINSIELANGTTHTLTATGGNLVIEGNVNYRAGGTNVAIADGGTNADDAATAFSNLKQAATESATGVVELATTAEVEAGTDTTRAATAAGVLAAVTGKKPIWIPAGSLVPRTTNGCAITDFEHPTNDIMERSCNFTQTEQGAGFTIRMPDTWDEGTLTAVFVWTHPATVTNFGVVWQVGCVSTSNDDARDAAIGTQQEIADTGGTTSDQYTTGATPALTCAGTPAAGDTVYFEFEREPGNGSDTLAVDAWLIGVTLYYTDNAFVEP